MGMFADIIAKIFPASHPALAAAPAQPSPVAPATTAAAQPSAASQPVDVEAVISAMPGAAGLNWKTSIVDLLKVLGLDSSLEARKGLAAELGYTGSTSDSAAMNIWLHSEVVAKLAANGGKLPADMKG
jgi:hypothetical protein